MENEKKLPQIVGSGFLSKNFKKYEKLFEKLNVCLYAAGVSDSQCTDKDLLEKDSSRLFNFKNLIRDDQILVYFSTCSIKDPSRNNTPYVKNKIIIENYIVKNFKKYLIVRLPEVVGKSTNKKTLINFFFNKIKQKSKFDLWAKASRSLIDIDDVVKILSNLLTKAKIENKIINIANPDKYTVIQIVNMIEILTSIKAKYNLINKGESKWEIDISEILDSIKDSNIKFNNNYLKNILEKYFI